MFLFQVLDIRSTHSQLNKLLTNHEKSEYRALIERPLVRHALNNELEIFVSSLLSMLKSIQNQLDSDDVAVKEVHICAEKYLKEFEGSSELFKLANLLLKELKTISESKMMEVVFNPRLVWAELEARSLSALGLVPPPAAAALDSIASALTHARALQQAALALSALVQAQAAVYWDDAEQLANYTHKLKEAVMNLDFHNTLGEHMVPSARPMMLQAALALLVLGQGQAAIYWDDAEQLANHTHKLKEAVLNLDFHNTLGERMVPSARRMMLQAALALSALGQGQAAIYWDDAEQLASYTHKLKEAVLNLESRVLPQYAGLAHGAVGAAHHAAGGAGAVGAGAGANSYLTSQHAAIRNIVEKLMDTELLAKQSEWKKGVKDIRDIIEKVEARGHKSTELWRSHWDWQLYKALECQYIKTLLSLHKHFPHVKVDLVLRGHAVRVQPAIEDIRVQHYHQLRRLVSLPAHFLEAALSSLERACKAWTRRAALACVPDLEALCMDHLKEPHDWEINFKACKAYGQAIAKMTFLWACLVSSLQASCRSDATELEAFIANATVMLENRALPKNAKELAEI
ncbi:Cytoplasmic dynein 2 heavy chain 1, partial [Operophtera brumata]